MGRGRALSEAEKDAIDAPHRDQKSISTIADKIKRTRYAVRNYLRKNSKKKDLKQVDRPSKLTPTAIRISGNVAKMPETTARKVLTQTGTKVSLRTVQRVLRNNENMEFGHLLRRPELEPRHNKMRFDWAKKFSWNDPRKWRRTIFSDEKRFCQGGPDRTACYWHDKRLQKKFFRSDLMEVEVLWYGLE